MVAPVPSGHSSDVRIELLANGSRFRLAQVGGGHLYFRGEVVLLGTEGELVVLVDEHQERWRVSWEASDTPRDVIRAEFRIVE